MGIYSKWQKEVSEKLSKFKKEENIPSRRCPKCFELGLEFDLKKGKIKCNKCGFEENILKIK